LPWRRVNESLIANVRQKEYLIEKDTIQTFQSTFQMVNLVLEFLLQFPHLNMCLRLLPWNQNKRNDPNWHPTVKEHSVEILSMLAVLEVRPGVILFKYPGRLFFSVSPRVSKGGGSAII
jgi:hypothetical protein